MVIAPVVGARGSQRTRASLGRVQDPYGRITTLGSLTLRKCAPSFIQALTVTPNSPYLCPLLQELRVQEIPLQKSTLTDLIKSRLPNNAPMTQNTAEGSPLHLSRLVISECPGIDLSTIIGLRELLIDVQVLSKETILRAQHNIEFGALPSE